MEVNARGYIVGMYNRTRPDLPNFSPADQPSPLLALYAGAPRRCYLYPQRAEFSGNRCRLHYAGGAVATVRLEEKDKYIKLTLESLQGREGISAIQWGCYYTTISGLLGDIIGVARDTTAAVNYAIGAWRSRTTPLAARPALRQTPAGADTWCTRRTAGAFRCRPNCMRASCSRWAATASATWRFTATRSLTTEWFTALRQAWIPVQAHQHPLPVARQAAGRPHLLARGRAHTAQ